MSNFYNFLEEISEYSNVKKSLDKTGKVSVFGCVDGAKSHLINSLCQSLDCRLIVTEDEVRANKLVQEYRNFDKNTFYFPPKDFYFLVQIFMETYYLKSECVHSKFF
ncbi:hypothetical protein P261_01921 [Lachnospiraceae bacterium TWA4]|nr:hypothetical protein P261_01921 [Lachnospiraceae bacterium TWA4]